MTPDYQHGNTPRNSTQARSHATTRRRRHTQPHAGTITPSWPGRSVVSKARPVAARTVVFGSRRCRGGPSPSGAGCGVCPLPSLCPRPPPGKVGGVLSPRLGGVRCLASPCWARPDGDRETRDEPAATDAPHETRTQDARDQHATRTRDAPHATSTRPTRGHRHGQAVGLRCTTPRLSISRGASPIRRGRRQNVP
jgi:hypothetical protein